MSIRNQTALKNHNLRRTKQIKQKKLHSCYVLPTLVYSMAPIVLLVLFRQICRLHSQHSSSSPRTDKTCRACSTPGQTRHSNGLKCGKPGSSSNIADRSLCCRRNGTCNNTYSMRKRRRKKGSLESSQPAFVYSYKKNQQYITLPDELNPTPPSARVVTTGANMVTPIPTPATAPIVRV